jgi:hypothetical protein
LCIIYGVHIDTFLVGLCAEKRVKYAVNGNYSLFDKFLNPYLNPSLKGDTDASFFGE